VVSINAEKNGLEIRFPRWSRFAGCWYHRDSPEAPSFADTLIRSQEGGWRDRWRCLRFVRCQGRLAPVPRAPEADGISGRAIGPRLLDLYARCGIQALEELAARIDPPKGGLHDIR
jgi:hypothetical protein